MRDEVRLGNFIRGASKLPVLPKVTIRLLVAVDSPERTSNDIAEIIEADPSLSAKLLKLANSSFYGQRGRISTIRNAVTVLGYKTIRSLALVVWTYTLRSQTRDVEEMMAPLLAHGLAAGVAAGMLAERINRDWSEDAFMAGLLHDIGRVALVAQMGKEYRTTISDPAEREGLLPHEKEGMTLGFDHRDLGSVLMQSWGLPSFLADVAEKHHDAGIAPRKQIFVAAVALADTLSTRLGFNVAHGTARPQQDEIAAFFGLQDQQAVAEFLMLCDARFMTFSKALE
jgi:HD-like signal output (HDOD) protein